MTTIQVRNPRSGEIDYQIPSFSENEVIRRAASLREAQKEWASLSIENRCAILKEWHTAISDNRDIIANALCLDTGRKAFSRFEVDVALKLIDHWIHRAPSLFKKDSGISNQVPSVNYQHTLIPYPIVAAISPWNVPLILGLIDAIPALAAGCAVMLKPSEITPRFAAPLEKTKNLVDGLSDVFTLIMGDGISGKAMIDAADAVCFTGSVATGRMVAVHAAERFIPAFLELGGKDPAIVTRQADLHKATDAIIRSAVGMTGQACQSLERIYVDKEIVDEFTDNLLERLASVKLNWPDIEDGHIGPIIHAPQAKIIQTQLSEAISDGATVIYGDGVMEHGGGLWCTPTVLTNISHKMRLMKEETFGPVIPIIAYHNIDEAIALANDTDFGLSAAVFCENQKEAIWIAERLTVGAISINDASLTSVVNDVEKNSFCYSGLGGSRMGDAGFTRFLRKRASLIQTAKPMSIDIFRESDVR